MQKPTDSQPLLNQHSKLSGDLPQTDMSEDEVRHMLGLDANKTAGSRSSDMNSRPSLPGEDAQLRAEQHESRNSHQASNVEAVKNAEGSGKRRSIVDMLKHPSHLRTPSQEKKEQRKSISESGPYEVVLNPETGKYITRPNPHWPNDDSWKRENVRTGKGDSGVIAPGGEGGVSYF